MGTPKSNRNEVVLLTMYEKLRVLSTGKRINFAFTVDNVTIVLEEVVEILLPLVQWLDKKLCDVFSNLTDEKFKNQRGMLLLDGWGWGIMDIALERSGQWLVRDKDICLSLKSDDMAKLIVKNYQDFSTISLFRHDFEMLKFVKANVFLKNISYRYSLIWLLSKFSESVEKQIKEREDRLKIMRQRLSGLCDFKTALDPLEVREKPLKLMGYSIFHEYESGATNVAGSYLSSSALDGFWKIANDRKGKEEEEGEEYVPVNSSLNISSLSDFLERISYMVREISEARRSNRTDALALFGYNSGRLPFTEDGMAVLKEMVRQIEMKL